MCNKDRAAEPSAASEDSARIHFAHILSQYLFSLSMMCKDYEWHKTGMHLCAASDELKVMLNDGETRQKRYRIDE